MEGWTMETGMIFIFSFRKVCNINEIYIMAVFMHRLYQAKSTMFRYKTKPAVPILLEFEQA